WPFTRGGPGVPAVGLHGAADRRTGAVRPRPVQSGEPAHVRRPPRGGARSGGGVPIAGGDGGRRSGDRLRAAVAWRARSAAGPSVRGGAAAGARARSVRGDGQHRGGAGGGDAPCAGTPRDGRVLSGYFGGSSGGGEGA